MGKFGLRDFASKRDVRHVFLTLTPTLALTLTLTLTLIYKPRTVGSH